MKSAQTLQDRAIGFFNRVLAVQTPDPEVRRRSTFLVVLSSGVLFTLAALVAINLFNWIASPSPKELFYIAADLAYGLIIAGLLFLNRSGYVRWAGYGFLILMIAMFTLSFGITTMDRVLMAYAIPVLASSFVISPGSSFLFALLSASAYTIAYLAGEPSQGYNYVSMMGLFVMAIVAWLAAQSLEDALRDMRQALARQSASENQVRRLNEDLQGRTRELDALNRAGRVMVSTLNSQAVLQLVIGEVRSLLDAEGASVLLRDPASDNLIFAAAAGSGAAGLVGARLPMTSGIAGWVMRERKTALVSDAHRDPRFCENVDEMTGLTTRSVVAVPLMFKGAVWGVVEAINKSGAVFTDRDCEVLEALTSSAAIAIENARLYEAEREQFRRLQHSQAQLVQSEKMAALGRLVASIAHEINNPLQAVQNSLDLTREELEGGMRRDKLTRYVGMAGNEIDRLTTIVRRMRDFYRPARDGMTTTDVHAVLKDVLELTGKQLQHSNIRVEREWAADLPPIRANPDYLKQVFLNLVLNAIDAMEAQGGTLRVYTALDHMQPAQGNAMLPAVCIEFNDTGEGIAPHDLPNLFEPFFTTKATGTGLGLSICYEIVQAHNGQITVESHPEAGTTFRILLPVGQQIATRSTLGSAA